MSSSDCGGRQVQALILSPRQFDVIYQVTYQLRNLQESRLEALGCTQTDLDSLLAALRPVRDQADSSSRVRIDFYDPSDLQEDVRDDLGEAEACGRLPRELAVRWNSLAELVISANGPRELFLVTGYYFDEIRDAIARLAEIDE